MIKIGTASFTTRRPKDLDDKLINSLGVSAARVARLLDQGASRWTFTMSLLPFLKEADANPGEIMRLVSQAGDEHAFREQVRALYADDQPEEPEATPTPAPSAANEDGGE